MQPLTNAQKQAAHRARVAAKALARDTALRMIADKLANTKTPLGMELRTIALTALEEAK